MHFKTILQLLFCNLTKFTYAINLESRRIYLVVFPFQFFCCFHLFALLGRFPFFSGFRSIHRYNISFSTHFPFRIPIPLLPYSGTVYLVFIVQRNSVWIIVIGSQHCYSTDYIIDHMCLSRKLFLLSVVLCCAALRVHGNSFA